MTGKEPTQLCPFCDGPTEPDATRPGVLYCGRCEAPVSFDPLNYATLAAYPEEELARDPELLAAWLGATARLVGYERVIGGLRAIKADCLDAYILETQGEAALGDWREYRR